MRKKANRYTKDDYVFVYQMLVLRSEGQSYPQIGKTFNKDHSTILYWCKRFNVKKGEPILPFDDFELKINKKELPENPKYLDMLDEHINRGKLTYAEYLKAADPIYRKLNRRY